MLVANISSFSRNGIHPIQKQISFLGHTNFVVCKCFEFGPVKSCHLVEITVSQTSPCIIVLQSFENTVEKKRNCSWRNFSFFPLCFLSLLENFLSFSSNFKLPSAKYLPLEESKIYRLGMGLKNLSVT